MAIISAVNDAWSDEFTGDWNDTTISLDMYSDSMYGGYVTIRFPLNVNSSSVCTAAAIKLICTHDSTGYLDITASIAVDGDNSFPNSFTDLDLRTLHAEEPGYYSGHTTGQTVSINVQPHIQWMIDNVGPTVTHLLFRLYGYGPEAGYYRFAAIENSTYDEPKLDITISGASSTFNETGSGGANAGSSALISNFSIITPDGGVLISGAADVPIPTQTYNEVGTGGLSTTGEAPTLTVTSVLGSGGAMAAGEAETLHNAIWSVTGGVLISGDNEPQYMGNLETDGGVWIAGESSVTSAGFHEEFGSGGANTSGSATDFAIMRDIATGGATLTGTADVLLSIHFVPTGGIEIDGDSQYGIIDTVDILIAGRSTRIKNLLWEQKIPIEGTVTRIERNGNEVIWRDLGDIVVIRDDIETEGNVYTITAER